jgi:hypothetical protein
VRANSFAFRAIHLFVLTAGAALGAAPTTAERDDATHDTANYTSSHSSTRELDGLAALQVTAPPE